MASDGVLTSSNISVRGLEVPMKPPRVSIATPAARLQFTADRPITLFWPRRNKLGRLSSNAAGVGRPAIVDPEVAAVDPAQVPQPGFKRSAAILEFRIGRIADQEHAHSAGLLRAPQAATLPPLPRAA
jgi:hypothetical protein